MEKKRSVAGYAMADTKIKTNLSNRKPIQANIPQDISSNLNVRIVPGRDFEINPIKKTCKSRTGADKRVAEPLDLPVSLRDKLKGVNKKVVDWLAADSANTQLYLAEPVKALQKAGVELTRQEQKHLLRTHQEVNDAMVLAPGVEVAKIDTKVLKRGRVGKIKPSVSKGSRDDHSVGCAKE